MRALVYTGQQTLRRLDVPWREPAAGDVVVNVLQAGICGTDLCIVRDERPKVEPPMTLGHEFVGRRADTGELVVVNPIVSCKCCRACNEGRTHLCERRQVVGVHRAGAFAERVAVPARNVLPAGSASLEQAAMTDPVATALHAFRLAASSKGPVAVLGAGTIGLSLLFVLKVFGFDDITVTDLAEPRLEFATAAGASRVGAQADGVYDVVFDTVGSVATRKAAARRVRPGGTAVLVGLHSAELVLPAGPLIGGERTIRGSFGYTEDEFREALTLVPQLDTRPVHTVGFDEAENAFADLLHGHADPSHVKIQMRLT